MKNRMNIAEISSHLSFVRAYKIHTFYLNYWHIEELHEQLGLRNNVYVNIFNIYYI